MSRIHHWSQDPPYRRSGHHAPHQAQERPGDAPLRPHRGPLDSQRDDRHGDMTTPSARPNAPPSTRWPDSMSTTYATKNPNRNSQAPTWPPLGERDAGADARSFSDDVAGTRGCRRSL